MPDILVKRNAELDDTINLIVARINTDFTSPYVRAICEKYNSQDPDRLAFLKRLQDYVYRNVPYVLDPPGSEFVYKPTTTILNGQGDCKKMTVMIGSVLRCANIPFCIKHVFYHDENFTHVYIICPYPNAKGYVTLDPVSNPYFDNEVKYQYANVYDQTGNKMNLYTGNRTGGGYQAQKVFLSGSAAIMDDLGAISGTGCPAMSGTQLDATLDWIFDDDSDNATNGIGRKSKEERKERRQEIKNKVKNVGLAPAREVFLALVHLNAVKLADRMLRAWNKDRNKVINLWQKLGGNIEDLKKQIAFGSKQTVSGRCGVALEAMIATATPVIVAVVKLMKELKTETEDDQKDLDKVSNNSGSTLVKLPPVTIKTVQTTVRRDTGVQDNGTPDSGNTPPTAGGDAFMQANSWHMIFYQLFRAGFYCGLFIPVSPAVAWTAFAGSLYYILLKQKFVRSKFSLIIKKP